MKNWSVMAMLLVAAVMASTVALDCRPVELVPCLPAIKTGSDPTASCCNKLKAQRPCFCGYIKDPDLRQYVTSPYAKKVATKCGVTFPKCR